MSKKYLQNWRRNQLDIEEFLEDSSTDESQGIVDNLSPNLHLEEYASSLEHMSTVQSDTEVQNSPRSVINRSSSESDTELQLDQIRNIDINPNLFSTELASWAVLHRCTRASINELIAVLRCNGHEDLPKDSRTLLKTPRHVPVSGKCGGDYIYMGITNGISRVLVDHPKLLNQTSNMIDLVINIDGVPLYKSSGTQLWPILCMFNKSDPFIVAIYCGGSKPNDIDEYLSDFFTEYNQLIMNGYLYENNIYQIQIKAFICDAPARQFIKCIKGHTGYFACERCTVTGEWLDNRMTFCDLDCQMRTNHDFNNMVYYHPRPKKAHQLCRTPLIDYGFDCIDNFPLDYMHLVCLGVLKRLLVAFKEGNRRCKLSNNLINQLSHNLVQFQSAIPSEFVRRPRSMDELRRWKATEFRQFLLYTGQVALKGVLSKEAYNHFLTLSIGMSMLVDKDKASDNRYVDYASQLLKYFVAKSSELYGESFVSYNVHSLTHLHKDIIHYQCTLDDISCFPFENYLQILKKFVRGTQNPLSQVVKRVTELENLNVTITKKELKTRATNNERDRWFLMNNEHYACIKEVRQNGFGCEILKTNQLTNFYVEPCESKLLGIYYLKNKNILLEQKLVHIDEFKRKVICLNYKSGLVLIPLLHNVSW